MAKEDQLKIWAFDDKKQKTENQTKTERLIEKLEEGGLNLQNQQKYAETVFAQIDAIDHQCDQLTHEYASMSTHFRNIMDDAAVKSRMSTSKTVPYEGYEALYKMAKIQKDILSWKYLQEEAMIVLLRRVSSLLTDVQGLEIQKDVLGQMREMDQKRNDMFLKVMESMKKSVDENFITFIKYIHDENKMDRKHLSYTNAEMMNTITKRNTELIRELANEGKITHSVAQKYIDEQAKEQLEALKKSALKPNQEPIVDDMKQKTAQANERLNEVREEIIPVQKQQNKIESKQDDVLDELNLL